MRELGIDDAFYANRERTFDEVLPWDQLSVGVNKKYLLREWDLANATQITDDCRLSHCEGCGVCQNLDVKIIDQRREENASS